MSTGHDKQTARDRPAKHDGSNIAFSIPLPVGTSRLGKSSKEEPHLWRMLEVSSEVIDKAKEETDRLCQKSNTCHARMLLLILKAHLPDALNELQSLVNDKEKKRKEIQRYKVAFDEKNAENKALLRENGNFQLSLAQHNEKRRLEFDTRTHAVEEKDVNFEMMRSENKRLMEEFEKAERNAKQMQESDQRECRYLHVNKTSEEDLKKKYEDEIQHLLVITQTQKAEITKYKRDFDEQRYKFKLMLQRLSNDKNVLQEIGREQKHNEKQHTEYKQSVDIEMYFKAKRDVDNLLCENSKLNENLAFANEISKMKEARFEQLKKRLETLEQEITDFKQNIATQNEAQEKYEHLKQKTHKLLQENQTLKTRLENETENSKHQVKQCDQLTLNAQEQRRKHDEQIKSLQLSFEKQHSENNKQHQQEVELLELEINKYREELNKKHETNQSFCELPILSDQLEAVNQTLREDLAREKQDAKTKEEESKQSFIQIKQTWETREKNLKLQQEQYHLRQEKSKLCKLLSPDDATNKEKEHDITVLNLQRLGEKQLEKINNLEAARKKQQKLHEENQELRCKLLKLLQEKEQMTCSGESYRKQEEIVKSSLKLRIQNLENDVDHLHNEKKKISEELLLEKDNAKKQKKEQEKTFQECIERQELEMKTLKAAFETQQTLYENHQKGKGEQEYYKPQETLTQVKENAKTQEEGSQNSKLEIQTPKEIIARRQTNDQKMKNDMQQQTLREESETFRKLNLLLDNRELKDDLRLEKDNAKKQANTNLKIMREMQQLKVKQEDTARMLKNAEDIQRTINAENLDLKNQVDSLRREKIERENEFVQEKENAREKEKNIKSTFNDNIHKLMEDNAKLQQVIDKQNKEIEKFMEMNKKLQNDARQHSTDTQVVEGYVVDKELQQQLAR